ncbi:Uu.00g012160.m01.CDS01 [Anthostomella pinea]|uniref:Uu.00g012160.m01.CDS01 n=1 Tax=Anthostomella pinea TaxID=933095 RepID=A0AAI8YMV7_9PEZI|nr:Uu.00g012160.m01.CDS01 [Anthostomella pinea]
MHFGVQMQTPDLEIALSTNKSEEDMQHGDDVFLIMSKCALDTKTTILRSGFKAVTMMISLEPFVMRTPSVYGIQSIRQPSHCSSAFVTSNNTLPLVEASPIWGIGSAAKGAEHTKNRENWGLNLLGGCLMEVREQFRWEDVEKGEEDGDDGVEAEEEAG